MTFKSFEAFKEYVPAAPSPSHQKAATNRLARLREALTAADFKEEDLPKCIFHVAGTNGKGSTVAFLKAFLEAAGHQVHTFTSPHIYSLTERITLNGHPIQEAALRALFEEVTPLLTTYHLSWFETLTLLAMVAFARTPADVLLLETGLGGQRDTTNVLTRVTASVITPISYDHTEILGPTLEQIAAAKAGIFKPQTPVFTAAQDPKVQAILQQHAQSLGCPLFCEDRDWRWRAQKSFWGFTYGTTTRHLPYSTNLPGLHQCQNAALALATLSQCYAPPETAHLIKGLEAAQWPGRLTILPHWQGLLPQGSEAYYDGAHNVAGATALANFLQERNAVAPLPLLLIGGFLRTKNVPEMIALFQSLNPQHFFIPLSHPQAFQPEDLSRFCPHSHQCTSLDEAFAWIRTHVTKPCRVVAWGSLYLAPSALRPI